MRVACIKIDNFRGIQQAKLFFPTHGVLIGDNNTGKTTILEALDLALGPDRLNRRPAIDEHDFFNGIYAIDADCAGEDGEKETTPPKVVIEVTITDLNEEQKGKFGDYIEFWDCDADEFYDAPDPAGVDAATITEALRVVGRKVIMNHITRYGDPVLRSHNISDVRVFGVCQQ